MASLPGCRPPSRTASDLDLSWSEPAGEPAGPLANSSGRPCSDRDLALASPNLPGQQPASALDPRTHPRKNAERKASSAKSRAIPRSPVEFDIAAPKQPLWDRDPAPTPVEWTGLAPRRADRGFSCRRERSSGSDAKRETETRSPVFGNGTG